MKNANSLSPDPETPCPERARLERDHDDATAAFETAGATIQARIGISSKDEYVRLERTAEEAWMRLQRARRALDDHIRITAVRGMAREVRRALAVAELAPARWFPIEVVGLRFDPALCAADARHSYDSALGSLNAATPNHSQNLGTNAKKSENLQVEEECRLTE